MLSALDAGIAFIKYSKGADFNENSAETIEMAEIDVSESPVLRGVRGVDAFSPFE